MEITEAVRPPGLTLLNCAWRHLSDEERRELWALYGLTQAEAGGRAIRSWDVECFSSMVDPKRRFLRVRVIPDDGFFRAETY